MALEVAGPDRLLPSWQCGDIAHLHLGRQAAGGDALVNDMRIVQYQSDRLALGTGPLAADVAFDGENARHVVRPLGHFLAHVQESAAAFAGDGLGFVVNLAQKQIRRQRLALGCSCPETRPECEIVRSREQWSLDPHRFCRQAGCAAQV